MSRKSKKDNLYFGDWFGMHRNVVTSPAWKQLSHGSRALFIALRTKLYKNNGHVYLSQRDAAELIGHHDRNDIANWFRELVHYGFIVQTEAAALGVDGQGKAPHWRFTDMATPMRDGTGRQDDPSRDFLKWDGTVFEPHVRPSRRWSERKQASLKKQNPGRHVPTTVDGTSLPSLDGTSLPPSGQSGSNVTPIQASPGGSNVTPISRLATRVAGGLLVNGGRDD
jgi:hypothetical protein